MSREGERHNDGAKESTELRARGLLLLRLRLPKSSASRLVPQPLGRALSATTPHWGGRPPAQAAMMRKCPPLSAPSRHPGCLKVPRRGGRAWGASS